MKERGVFPRILELTAVIGGIYLVSSLALTKKQRDAILERDEYESQMRHYSEEKGWHTKSADTPVGTAKPHVHHIDPQRNGGGDTPENTLTVWEYEHTGRLPDGSFVDGEKEFVIHPDMQPTFSRYRKGDKSAFEVMANTRNRILEEGGKYHNSDHDDEMLETAMERTATAKSRGWKFPFKRKK